MGFFTRCRCGGGAGRVYVSFVRSWWARARLLYVRRLQPQSGESSSSSFSLLDVATTSKCGSLFSTSYAGRAVPSLDLSPDGCRSSMG